MRAVSGKASLNVADLMLDRGASLSGRDANGDTPLHRAVADGHFRIACHLVERGADVDAINSDKQSAADLCTREQREMLLEACSNASSKPTP